MHRLPDTAKRKPLACLLTTIPKRKEKEAYLQSPLAVGVESVQRCGFGFFNEIFWVDDDVVVSETRCLGQDTVCELRPIITPHTIFGRLVLGASPASPRQTR